MHELDFSYQGFEWVDFKDNESSVISFLRKSRSSDRQVLVVCNMTPVVRNNYRVGVSRDGFYKEILNSDAQEYNGSGVGNLGGLNSETVPWHDRPFSLNLVLPPLAIIMLERTE